MSSDEEECSPPKKKTAVTKARPSSTSATKEKVKVKKRKDDDFEMESPPVSDHGGNEKPNKRKLGTKPSLSNVKTEKVPVVPSKGTANIPPKKNECVSCFTLLNSKKTSIF